FAGPGALLPERDDVTRIVGDRGIDERRAAVTVPRVLRLDHAEYYGNIRWQHREARAGRIARNERCLCGRTVNQDTRHQRLGENVIGHRRSRSVQANVLGRRRLSDARHQTIARDDPELQLVRTGDGGPAVIPARGEGEGESKSEYRDTTQHRHTSEVRVRA